MRATLAVFDPRDPRGMRSPDLRAGTEPRRELDPPRWTPKQPWIATICDSWPIEAPPACQASPVLRAPVPTNADPIA